MSERGVIVKCWSQGDCVELTDALEHTPTPGAAYHCPWSDAMLDPRAAFYSQAFIQNAWKAGVRDPGLLHKQHLQLQGLMSKAD